MPYMGSMIEVSLNKCLQLFYPKVGMFSHSGTTLVETLLIRCHLALQFQGDTVCSSSNLLPAPFPGSLPRVTDV